MFHLPADSHEGSSNHLQDQSYLESHVNSHVQHHSKDSLQEYPKDHSSQVKSHVQYYFKDSPRRDRSQVQDYPEDQNSHVQSHVQYHTKDPLQEYPKDHGSHVKSHVQDPSSHPKKDHKKHPKNRTSHVNDHGSKPNEPSVHFSLPERQVLWALSIIERDALEAKLALMNKGRDVKNCYSEDDPKVQLLAKQTYLILAKRYVSTLGSLGFEGRQLDRLVGDGGAKARAHLGSEYRKFLEAAARQPGEPSSSSPASRKATASTDSAKVTSPGMLSPVSDQFPPNFTFSRAGGAPEFPSQYASEYEELCLLGKGGYGHVYCVRNYADKQKYAVKKILLTSACLKKNRKKAQVEALLRELRTMAKLDHPNVVRYYHGWIEASPPPTSETEQDLESNLGKLPRKDIEGSTSSSEATGDVDLNSLQINNDEDVEDLDQAFKSLNYDSANDNVVFGYSSPEASRGPESIGHERRCSTPNITSTTTLVPTIRRVREADDPGLENIPTVDTSGNIHLAVPRRILSPEGSAAQVTPVISEDSSEANIFLGKDIIIHIKMSLHPLTLSRYLSMDEIAPNDACLIRHCFHQDSSVGLLTAILDGMEYLHGEKIVHRDLKPANILLSVRHDRPSSSSGCINIRSCAECAHARESSGIYVTPHIADFGLTAQLKDAPIPTGRASCDSSVAPQEKSKTKPLSAFVPRPVGTAFYRPAVMPADEPYICQKLDVYSLGVIAFEMIFSFSTKSERVKVLMDLKKGMLPTAMEGHDMANGIRRMVCADRDRRWGCREVRNWLQGLAGKGQAAGSAGV